MLVVRLAHDPVAAGLLDQLARLERLLQLIDLRPQPLQLAEARQRAVGPRARTQAEGFDVGFEDLPDGHLNQPNAEYFRFLDKLLDILVEHGLVPVLQPVFQGFGWKGLDVAGTVVPPAEYAAYCRYLLARYGAPPAIYLAGGHGNSGYARAVLATTDGRHFRSVAMLPVPVRYPAVAVAGGDLWVFGGLTPHGPVADIQRVNLRTGQAQRAGRLPRPLEAGSAFTLADSIYVAGGTTIGSPGTQGGARPLVTTSVVRRFAPRNRSFQIAGRLPAPVSHAAVAVTGGVAYLVGGLDGSQPVRTISTLRLGGSAGLVGKP